MDTIDLCGAVAGGLERSVPDVRQVAFYPSSASCRLPGGVIGDCMRKQYWYYKGEAKTDPPSENATVNMALGDTTHEFVVTQCKKVGLWAADECRIWDPILNVSGRVDLFLWHGDNIIPVEIKSVHGYHGVKGVIKNSRETPFAPKEEHVLQLFTYMDFYHRNPDLLPGGEPPYCLVFYIARDTGERAQHTIRLGVVCDDNGPVMHEINGVQMEVTFPIVNGVRWDFITNVGIYERWVELSRYIETSELPPRDFLLQYSRDTLKQMAENGELTDKQAVDVNADRWLEKGDWRCSYCPFKSKCWAGISKHDLYLGSENIES